MKDWIKGAFLTAGLVIVILSILGIACDYYDYNRALDNYMAEFREVCAFNNGYTAGLKDYREGNKFVLKQYPVKPKLEDYLGR